MSEGEVDPELIADLERYQAEEAAQWAALGDDPSELHQGLLAVSWMLGQWQGEAVLAGLDGSPDAPVTVQMVFAHEGAAALRYNYRVSIEGRIIDSESGWWRLTDPTTVEAVIAHPTGVVEVSVGSAAGGRVELGSDLVARTSTGADDRSYSRLYGRVDGRLLFAVDVAVGEGAPRPRISGALDKV